MTGSIIGPAGNKLNSKQFNLFFIYRLDYWSGHGRTNQTVCYGPDIAHYDGAYHNVIIHEPPVT